MYSKELLTWECYTVDTGAKEEGRDRQPISYSTATGNVLGEWLRDEMCPNTLSGMYRVWFQPCLPVARRMLLLRTSDDYAIRNMQVFLFPNGPNLFPLWLWAQLIGYVSSPLVNRRKESNTLWSTESLKTDSKQSKTKTSETIRSTSIHCELR